ncbi:TonB-dependent receptor [Lewinella cohaerens]|uniref:TonB-dependent receptor n=1 Tax=Lewinella cohaerens TaxID=70995 RepID=UPI00036A41A5|nr:TonB-dependent receptor [Lewinella cohaerens]
MKPILLAFCCLLLTITAFAQTFPVQGKIVDATNGGVLPGAHVVLANKIDNTTIATISDDKGVFRFDAVQNGAYQLSVSFIGFQETRREVIVNGQAFDLGALQLSEGVELEEVQVTEKVLPVLQMGDTTQFNADAYKTLSDASAEDLVEKMPTVNLEDGKIQAQGEDVKQVLVDGKPFFGSDPTAALRNLPAEVIDKIQIFDQQSEQAQFTGFDDGEASKTINIITKQTMRNGTFGKIYAGYGYEDKYQAGGNINFFSGDQRISILGLSNNINQQNFSSEDLLGVVSSSGGGRRGGRGGGGRGGRGSNNGGNANDFLVSQQGGITNSNAFGLNFSDKWGEKIELSASYFFNTADNTTEQLVRQQFFDTEGIDEFYTEESYTNSINTNHRFSGRLNYEINPNNSLTWQPTLSWQGNEGAEDLLGQTLLNDNLLSQTDLGFNADLAALNLSNKLLWRHKFEKRRRTFSVNLNSGYAPKEGENFLFSESVFSSLSTDSTFLQQKSTLDLNSWNIAANVQYTEPIGQNSMLTFNYGASYQQEESDKETLDFDEGSQDYDVFNSSLSNLFSNDYYTQQLGTGYNYRKRDLSITTRASVQQANLIGEQTFPFDNTSKHTFTNILPLLRLRYKISQSESFNLSYRANTQLPSTEQLQEVLNNNNPLQLTIGNADLVQAFQHSINARYSKTNTEKSSVFFVLLRGNYTNNYLGQSTYLGAGGGNFPILDENNVAAGAQLTQTVNIDGYWNLRSLITYGFPLTFLKSNLNLDFSADYLKTPGLVNEALNYSNNTGYGIGITLSSNISEHVDFTISSRSKYSTVTNSLQTQSNTNYLNQNTRIKLGWVSGSGLVFRTDLNHQFYRGLSDDFDQNYLLWNMSVGKKFFESQRGEIALSVFDLLKQNNSLSRNITETYTEDQQTNTLQQYFMLSFKYDLRKFKTS